jgi:hypothetical protein
MMVVVIRALAGGRPVATRLTVVGRCALLCLVASGCFYVDPINQRPSLEIEQTSTDVVYRGDSVKLRAVANDPDDQFVFFHWRAYAATDESDYDNAPFYEMSGDLEYDTAEFVVPSDRVDTMVAVEAIRVVLEGQDEYGATARPEQQLWIPVANRAPTLELRKDSRYGYVVTKPINVYAKVGDPDDWPNVPELTWEVFTPPDQPEYMLDDLTVDPAPDDTTHAQLGKTFTPEGIGDYEIRVTATDRLGEPTVKSIMVTVADDAPPCLQQLTPLVATAPAALPMAEPTLFQVHVVTDDLDPYPGVDDPQLGTATFTWSLLAPGMAARQTLNGVSGNGVALDPASYHPGDILELRVEIADRVPRMLMCADDNPTCSVISDDNCLQRQTWRIEVR